MKRVLLILVVALLYTSLTAQEAWEEDLAIKKGANLNFLEQTWDTFRYANWVFPARDGENIVMWTATRSRQRELMMARVSADGTYTWSPTLLFSHAPAILPVDLVTLDEEGYALIWRFSASKDGPFESFVQFIGEDGALQGESISLQAENLYYDHTLYSWQASNGEVLCLTRQMQPEGGRSDILVHVTPSGVSSTETIELPNTENSDIFKASNLGDKLLVTFLDSTDALCAQCYEPGVGLYWTENTTLNDDGHIFHFDFFASNDDGCFFVDYYGDESVIHFVDIDGAIAWSDTVSQTHCIEPSSRSKYSDNLLVVWRGEVFDNVRMYNASGEIVWETQLIHPDNSANYMEYYWYTQQDGEAYLVQVNDGDTWGDQDCFIHHILSDGSLEYGIDGLYREISCGDPYLLPFPNEDSMALYYVQNEALVRYLYMETWRQGTLVNETCFDHGLDGYAEIIGAGKCDANAHTFYTLWLARSPYTAGHYIYLQVHNGNAGTMLEENGLLLDSGEIYFNEIDNPLLVHDWRFYLLYEKDNALLMKQFNRQGEHLADDMVILPSMECIDEIVTEMRDGVVRLSWLEEDYLNLTNTLCIQEFDENGPLWTTPFRLEFSVENVSHDFDLYDEYVTWRSFDGEPYVLRVVDGETAENWPVGGHRFAEETRLIDSVVYNDDLYMLNYVAGSEGMYDLTMYRVTPDFEIPWGADGVEIVNPSMRRQNTMIANDNGVYFMLTGDINIIAMKMQPDGVLAWGDNGLQVAESIAARANHLKTTLLDNGAIACTWSEYEVNDIWGWRNLRCCAFDCAGNVFTGFYGLPLTDERCDQTNVFVYEDAGDLFAVWEDYRTANNDCNITSNEIYAQRYDLNMVDVDEAPPVQGLWLCNQPNPFNPETTFRFSLPSDSDVELTVYNIRGQRVTELMNQPMEAGDHSIVWRANDQSSGVYFIRLKTADGEITRKTLLLK